MPSRSRKIAAAVAAIGLFSLSHPLYAAVVYTWNGTGANWQTTTGWNPTSQSGGPTSSDEALFNNTGSGATTVALGGSGSAASIDFAAGTQYTIGSSTDTLNLGAVTGAVTDAATVNEAINSSISFAGSASVVNSAGANLTLGVSGSGATINLPTSSTLTLNTTNAGAMLTVNDSIQGSTENISVNGSTAGTLLFNGLSTYSGTTTVTNISAGTVIGIGSSTDAGFTKGPFGTSTINQSTTNAVYYEAIGADQTIANPISLSTGWQFANAASAQNLTLTGAISFVPTTSRTVTINIPGQTLTLGSAATPSTITLATNNTYNLAFDTTANSTLVLNDVIQNGAGTNSIMSFNPVGSNTPEGTVLITAANTYSGGTTFNAQTATTNGPYGALTVEIGSDSGASSGPFGTGPITMNDGNAPPILEAHGADRTVSNAITLTSGFFVAADASGAHNLTLSGPMGTDQTVITNNLPAGVALFLGSAASPSTINFSNVGGGTPKFQSQIPGGGVTVINDKITGTSGPVTYQNHGTYYINNPANTYSGNTNVTGTGTVGQGNNGLGTGATLAGKGVVGTGAGLVTIGSTTAGSVGGIVSPGGDGMSPSTMTGPGTLTMNRLALDPYGQYIYQYSATDNSSSDGANDLINITAAAGLNISALSSSTPFDLDLVDLGSGNVSGPYTLATFLSITGASANQDVTSDFSFSGVTPQSVTVSSDGKSLLVTFAPTPEPGSLSLLSLGAIGLIRRRRRQV